MTDNSPQTPGTLTAAEGRAADRITAEAKRRRTFAVISHPDAGKSTLTEALVLHANRISEAGAIHGKSGRRATVSDWMDMEKARGISITSTALQFPYRAPSGQDCVINLLDTPGHADFSEDTYRVLTAVDCAVMLIDAAKGLEPQTLKLFEVCRLRRIPIITVINKWDRPGRDPLELLDEIQSRIGLRPTPLTWPVGIAGDFKGVLDRRTGNFIRYTRTAGGAKAAPEEHIAPADAHDAAGVDWDNAVEESELLAADGSDYDEDTFLGCETTPLLFTSAALNFGVNQLLDVLVQLAPSPHGQLDVDGHRRPAEAPFSAFVFKVQAGMDSAHRDRIAYARVCSGTFERGEVLTHATTGKPFVTKYAQSVFGQQRSTLDTAWPGDVIGLANANVLRPGDTLYRDIPVQYPPIPSFSPSSSPSPVAPIPASTSSSARASTSSSRRASSRSCVRTAAATRPPSSPPWDRCSSRWRRTGWRPNSARRSRWSRSRTRWRAPPIPVTSSSCSGNRRSRSSRAPTASSWCCSPPSGGWRDSSATTRR